MISAEKNSVETGKTEGKNLIKKWKKPPETGRR